MPKCVLRLVGNDFPVPVVRQRINPVVVTLSVCPSPIISPAALPIASISSSDDSNLGRGGGDQDNAAGVTVRPFTHNGTVGDGGDGDGIAIQGLSEQAFKPALSRICPKSPPAGAIGEGADLGYSHLNNFFSWLIGCHPVRYIIDAFVPIRASSQWGGICMARVLVERSAACGRPPGTAGLCSSASTSLASSACCGFAR